MNDTCPFCEGELQAQIYDRDVLYDDVTINVDNLQRYYCPFCEVDLTSAEQLVHNYKLIFNAFNAN